MIIMNDLSYMVFGQVSDGKEGQGVYATDTPYCLELLNQTTFALFHNQTCRRSATDLLSG